MNDRTQGGSGDVGTMIFSYICRLGPFSGVQNFEFQYYLGFSEKLIFLGYEDYVDMFWAISAHLNQTPHKATSNQGQRISLAQVFY